jgi:SAM-dependent methyltransferase
VFVAQLLHHFDEATNRELARRVARALRPGGIFVVQEMIRPGSSREAGQVGALLDFYFASTSASGTWTVDEIASWQRDAGLRVRKPLWLRSLPGSAQQAGVKPPA